MSHSDNVVDIEIHFICRPLVVVIPLGEIAKLAMITENGSTAPCHSATGKPHCGVTSSDYSLLTKLAALPLLLAAALIPEAGR